MKKVLLSIILVFCLLFTSIPVAFAAIPSSPIPGAEVEILSSEKVGNYLSNEVQAAVYFKAIEDGVAAEENGYGDWITDFYLSFSGINGEKLIGDENCYMVGKLWGFERAIPLNEVEVVSGVEYPIIAGLTEGAITYYDVCEYIEEFVAGLYISPEILEQHPNLGIKLSLKATDPDNSDNVMTVGKAAYFTVVPSEPESYTLSGNLMNIVASFSPAPPPAVEPTEICKPDEHAFEVNESDNGYYTCIKCGSDATMVSPSSSKSDFTLETAISNAKDGDILLLSNGTYYTQSLINIRTKLSIIGQGENNSIIKSTTENHIFVIGDGIPAFENSNKAKLRELTLANLTADGSNDNGKTAKAGINAKYNSITNLYHVTIKNTNPVWGNILLDNGNTPYFEDCTTIVNAYDVTVDLPVNLNALPNTNIQDSEYKFVTTYTQFNYEGGNIEEKGVAPQSCSQGGNNITVNGIVINPALASLTYNDAITYYNSLSNAISVINNNNAPDGDYTITLLEDCDEDVIISQQEGVNVTITAANKTDIEYTGTITISGEKRSGGNETLTIKDIKFDASDYTTGHDGIDLDFKTPKPVKEQEKYPHNIIITGCIFVDDDNNLTAIRARQVYDLTISDCIQTGGFQFLWCDSSSENKTNINKIENINVSGVTEGINTGISAFTINNAVIDATNFAVRLNTEVGEDKDHTISGCAFTSKTPIVLRTNSEVKSTSVVNITNTKLTVSSGGNKCIDTAYTGNKPANDAVINSTNNSFSYVDAVAKIKDKVIDGYLNYLTLDDALDAASTEDTVVLLKENSIAEDITINNVDVDLDSKILSIPEGKKLSLISAKIDNGSFLEVAGEIILASEDACVSASPGLNITTSISNSKVAYASGTYIVVPDDAVAKNNDTYFTSLTEAISKANAGDTIELLQNADGDISIDKNITLTLSNYTCTGTVTLTHNTTLTSDNNALNVVTTGNYSIIKGGSEGNYTYLSKSNYVPSTTPTPPVVEKEDVSCDGTVECGCGAAHFSDINTGKWYHDAIDYVVEEGIMNGIAEDKFDPNGNATRSMLMTMLARVAGVDTEGGSSWDEKGMEWAIENKISDGSAPGENITREQLAVMLLNYRKTVTADDKKADISSFADSLTVSDWAKDAISWAVGNGIINGKSADMLKPGDGATRAEAAAIIKRFKMLEE